MKKVLIVGEHSYVGCSFYQYAKDKFEIKLVSSRDGAWEKEDFHGYDSLLHCAGIAHISQKKSMRDQYFSVNRDLAFEVAKKAKAEGVCQFILLSSIIVYGSEKEIGKTYMIDQNTKAHPANFYGESKLQAEREITALEGDGFFSCIIRSPMVYGYGCKGNFPKLLKYANTLPFFPDIQNDRSMIHIENLCEFLSLAVNQQKRGLYLPQNSEYISTKRIFSEAAKIYGKKMSFIRCCNPLLRLLSRRISYINKVFGNKTYQHDIDEKEYNIVSFEESIKFSLMGGSTCDF